MGITSPKNIDDLVKENKSLTLNQIEDIVKNYNEYFDKSNTDNIYLNLNKIKKFIKSKVIQNIITSKFSNEHFRVYNLLNLVGSLDQKNIIDLCLIGPKKINYIINQLFQEGFIKTDTVNFNGNNMLFYSVDDFQTTEKILEMDFKIINNYNYYYYDQMKNIKNKFIDNKKKNEELVKLTYTIENAAGGTWYLSNSKGKIDKQTSTEVNITITSPKSGSIDLIYKRDNEDDIVKTITIKSL